MSSHRTGYEEADPTVHDDIAIIGMACLFPGAPDLDTYWQNIVSKVDAITDPPPEAWDADVFYDPDSTANDRVYCKRGGFLGPLAYFDPLEHGVIPLAVEGSEPDQWLALQVAHAALTDAGYGDEIPECHRTAVILGKGNYPNRGNSTVSQHGRVVDQTLEILKTLHPQYTEADLQLIRTELKQSLPSFNSDTAPGLIPNIIAGRIANRLDLMGPSYTVDAACASFLVAANAAIRGLRHREYDLALVGGAQGWTPVPMLALFCQLGALSRREQIRPFDRDADGTILGEGIGMVVLKRREDAERDGNRIYAIIKGVGVSSDGRGVSVMAPRLEGEVLALQRAYEMAGVSPRTIGLIEAHGTGTLVGDATEIDALTQVFGPRDGLLPWCALGSVKSMIGHLMPAAGVAGLIKAALALYHKVLPPTLNVDEPNPAFEPHSTPFYVNTETRPWIHNARDVPRRAGVNAFGFGGINAHVILEEYPVPNESALQSHHQQWDTEVYILSAESRSGLIRRVQQLYQSLQTGVEVRLKDLAYTLNVPLDEGPYRVSIVASTVEDLTQKLERVLERLSDPECLKIKDVKGIYFFEERLAESGRLAFLFPGEGSQYINMLADLCFHFPEVRESFDLIDRVFADHARGYVLSDIIYPRPTFSETEREATKERLWQIEGAVEAVLAASRALSALLSRLGVYPDAVVGHSTGEYSAMLASGMIDLGDESLVGQFASELNRIYQRATAEDGIPRAALVAVAAGREAVSAFIDEEGSDLYVAMDNCPHQTVIVGEEAIVERAIEQLQHRGLIFERLPFDRPYHTPLFDGFSARLQAFFDRWIASPPQVETYSCTIAAPFTTDLAQVRKVAVEHWVRPVEFRRTVEAMYDDGIRIFVEIGPRGSLTAFVDDVLRGQPHLAVSANVMQRSGTAQLNHLVGMLAAHGVSMQLDRLYARRSPRRLDLDPAGEVESDGRKLAGRIKLRTGWPSLCLSEEVAARLRPKTQATLFADAGAGVPASPVAPSLDARIGAEDIPAGRAIAPLDTEDVPAVTARPPQLRAQPESTDQVMSAYLETMEQFLAVQQQVMEAFLTGVPQVSVVPPASVAKMQEGRVAEEPASEQPRQPSPVETEPPAQLPPSPEDGEDGQPALLSLSEEKITGMLLQLVSERTGYPVEMIDLSLDLEADLGIDSIKRVEILGLFQQQTGLFRAEDMEGLSGRKSLQEVVDFLATQSEGSPNGDSPAPAGTARKVPVQDSQAIPSMPFIGNIVSLTSGEELVARCEINLTEALFLGDHTLGRQVAIADPELRGLPVMPLTVSMEMLAQAATILAPGQRLIGMRDVRAHRWIVLEGDGLTLELAARRASPVSDHEIYAQIREIDATTPIVGGTMIFDSGYPEPPVADELVLRDERSSRWSPEQLYQDVMFHGPAFQGVVSVDRWGSDGAEATLQALPTDNLFRSDPTPHLITDPVLLDQPGQVVGFWTSDHLETGYVVFPFRLEALHLYGPNPSPPERLKCHARIDLVGEGQVRSDLHIVRSDGRVWARLLGWWDRRFDLPDAAFRIMLSPQDVMLSGPWSASAALAPPSAGLQVCRLSEDAFPEGFFTAHGGIWRRVLAHVVLGRRERELWSNFRTPEPRRLEWLLGRIAGKDAVRQYLRQHYDMILCPADVEILPDDAGCPVAQGPWVERVSRPLALSISHAAGVAVAAVGDGDRGVGMGVDVERVGRMNEDVESLVFTPQEQELLSALRGGQTDEWPLRLWCAKEAVAKAVGQGMVGGPQGLIVEALDAPSGEVQIGLAGELARRVSDQDGSSLRAFTARDGDLILAISLVRREGKVEENADKS